MSETKEYTLRAINKYNGKFDRIAVNLPKGSKEWIKENTGKSCNAFFNDLFTEYQRKRSAPDPQEIRTIDQYDTSTDFPEMPFS